MNKQPGTRKLQAPSEANSNFIHPANEQWQKIYAAITDPDLQTIVAFCLIGLLVTLNFMLRFPDMGAVIAQYNQF